jgi:hypothetical protein
MRRALNTAKVALATPRMMLAGHRFARQLPAQPLPATEPGDLGNPLEDYFDSVTEGPGLWKWRHYFPIYHRHLHKFVGQDVHLVEIGIFSGGSLPMWRSYFGDGCTVYGVDIEPACSKHQQDGVKVFIGDQSDPAFWQRFLPAVPRIDVVIDDGGHEAHQQIPTLQALLPRMAANGVYICEDIVGRGHQFHSFVDGLTRQLSDLDTRPHTEGRIDSAAPALPVHQHVGSVHRYPAVTVIEKPDRPVQRFVSEKHGTVWQPGVYAQSHEKG